MATKAEILRMRIYGQSTYRLALQAQEGYQKELDKVKAGTPQKKWIESPFQVPRWTDDEMDKKIKDYQDRYGTTYQIPNIDNIFHVKPRTVISDEDLAAHRYAQKRKLPSPLDEDQLAEMAARRERYLSYISSPSGSLRRNVTSILTAVDNAEDALVTLAVLGRLAIKVLPALAKRLTGPLGWALLGSDLLNLVNTMSLLTAAGNTHKRMSEHFTEKNPFNEKARIARATKLKRTLPTYGEFLEIAQTTDQLFGMGICLGSIMGFYGDMVVEGWQQVQKFGVNVAATIAVPSGWEVIWQDTIKSAAIIWAGIPDIPKAVLRDITLAAEVGVHEGMPWLGTANPLDNVYQIGNFYMKAPKPRKNSTKDTLQEAGIDPWAEISWPLIDNPRPTPDEFLYAYAPAIKENFQTYALENQHDTEAMAVCHTASQFTTTTMAAFSDDGQVEISNTGMAGAVKDMAQQILQLPPNTPSALQNQLTDYIMQYERQTGASPPINDIKTFGDKIGIKWNREGNQPTPRQLDELFPGWRAIQDQLGQTWKPHTE